jgi:hypothetical protein
MTQIERMTTDVLFRNIPLKPNVVKPQRAQRDLVFVSGSF